MTTITAPLSSEVAREGAMPINAACKFSGLSRATLYEAIGRGELASAKVGRRRLVYTADLKRFLAASADSK